MAASGWIGIIHYIYIQRQHTNTYNIYNAIKKIVKRKRMK